jgi:D-alanyl-D-alanine-carboxypeptidase/D-alanyl-D-alanine-endopeptidase
MTGLSRRRFLTATAGLATAAGSGLLAATPAGAAPARDARLRSAVDEHLARAIDELGHVGMVIGVHDGSTGYVAGAGRAGAPGSPAPHAGTIFQLGSITKTFTGLSLAREHCRGTLRLAAPANGPLPGWLPVPDGSTRPVTLVDLATHTSGLPALPPGIEHDPAFDIRDPYAAFSLGDLSTALRATELLTEPGAKFRYSNYGFGVLGQALGARDELRYEALVRPITRSLGLRDTTVRLTPRQLRRKAQGHAQGQPTPDWRMGPLAAAGSLYGTVPDLLRYLCAHQQGAPGHLARAMELATRPHFTAADGADHGLGWAHLRLPSTGQRMVWHNGATGGFCSFAGFCPESGLSVALLTNSAIFADGLAISLADALTR